MLKYTKWILVFTLLLMLALPTLAQEATPEPDQTVQVTVSSGGATTNEGSSIVLSALQVVVGLVAAFGLGGIGGVLGAGVLASRLRNDPATMAAIEALGSSVPPDTAKQIMAMSGDFNKSVNELTTLIQEALDNIPASTKPPTPTL